MNYFAIPGLIRETKESFDHKKVRGIIQVVCAIYKVSGEQLLKKTHKREIVLPRQLIQYLLRRCTNMSLKSIGAIYNQHHTSVIHAIKEIENLIFSDIDFRNSVNEIKLKINS